MNTLFKIGQPVSSKTRKFYIVFIGNDTVAVKNDDGSVTMTDMVFYSDDGLDWIPEHELVSTTSHSDIQRLTLV